MQVRHVISSFIPQQTTSSNPPGNDTVLNQIIASVNKMLKLIMCEQNTTGHKSCLTEHLTSLLDLNKHSKS